MKKMPLIMIAMLGCLLPGLMTASMADSESSETEARIQRRAVVDD